MFIINVLFGRLDFVGKGFYNFRRIYKKYNFFYRDWLGGSCFGKDYITYSNKIKMIYNYMI